MSTAIVFLISVAAGGLFFAAACWGSAYRPAHAAAPSYKRAPRRGVTTAALAACLYLTVPTCLYLTVPHALAARQVSR